ncbi:MAG TPA: FAD-dependent oxidoreductase [Deinococcales bacterium]|nr:FAD-dependent oxidoreductase [Deinococcales bacterium]
MTTGTDNPRPRPIILAVDDEPQVLGAIERDLRRRYGKEYRVLRASSASEALGALDELKRRGEAVALLVSDQRMPHVSGVEFLEQSLSSAPGARKVLLTAYADTTAAIAAINRVGLDHYLMKPWDPPEQNLFPVIDDLLEEWAASTELPYKGIRVVGTLWSPASHQVKGFLASNRVPYRWIDLESDKEGEALLATLPADGRQLPLVFFPDGTVLSNPKDRDLAGHLGMRSQANHPFYDLVIIGGGPAGLGAAVYGASEGLRTLLVERSAPGGQAGTSSRIENYLGFPNGLSGADLARRAEAQARRFGAEILCPQEVASVGVDGPFRVTTLADGSELRSHTLLIATGMTVKGLEVPGAADLTGAGIYYGAAVTEAAHYRGKHVFVIGGANSAGQGAMFFSRYASRVTLLVRAGSLEKGMSQYLVEQIRGQANIEVLTSTVVDSVHGSLRLEAITVSNLATGQCRTLEADAMFIFIGAVPHTAFLQGVVEMNAAGFIPTGSELLRDGARPRGWGLPRDPYLLEASVPGIFAAGDVRQGVVRRVASAVGEGAIAVSLVHEYLKTV